MNLRDAHFTSDARLAPALEVPEVEQLSLALVEYPEALGERGSVLSELVALLEYAVLAGPVLEILDELRGVSSERWIELLNAAGDPDRPCSIAEVPLDLAVDRRDRERREINTAIELEPVDRVDQPDRADLDEILELLAPTRRGAGPASVRAGGTVGSGGRAPPCLRARGTPVAAFVPRRGAPQPPSQRRGAGVRRPAAASKRAVTIRCAAQP